MNNIVDVYDMWSVGQLIPIIIGAGGLAVAAAELYVYKRQEILGVDWEGSVRVRAIGGPGSEHKEPSEETHGQGVGLSNREESPTEITIADEKRL